MNRITSTVVHSHCSSFILYLGFISTSNILPHCQSPITSGMNVIPSHHVSIFKWDFKCNSSIQTIHWWDRFNPFGSRGCGLQQFEYPGGVTTSSEPFAAVIVADTGNKRVCSFSFATDHRGYGTLNQTHEFGHQIFKEPLGLIFLCTIALHVHLSW